MMLLPCEELVDVIPDSCSLSVLYFYSQLFAKVYASRPVKPPFKAIHSTFDIL